MATVDPAAQDNYIYNRLLKERIIWLGSEVRDENANEIAAKLLLLAAEDPEKDIYLYINSPGGSITAGMAIYDTMQFVPNDIVTVGHRHGRLDGPVPADRRHQGQALHHAERPRPAAPALTAASAAPPRDIQIQAELILAHEEASWPRLTAEQTGKTVEQILKDGDRDRWFTRPGGPRIRLRRQDPRARRRRHRRRRNATPTPAPKN